MSIKTALLIGILLAVSVPAYAQRQYPWPPIMSPGWEQREHEMRREERARERERERERHQGWCYYHPRECR
jgi:hypothetical protein